MFKKLLSVTLFAFVLSAHSFGQCTPNVALTATGYYPDSVQGLPPAFATVLYSTVVQVRTPKDTVIAPFGTITINYIQLDSVKGLPAGFTYTTNPSTGKFPGGSNGCILLTGTGTVPQETGGPKLDGKYPIIVYYHTNVTVPVVGVTNQAGTNDYYHITMLPASAAGIVESENEKFNVLPNSPNPANNHTDICYWTPGVDNNVEFKVYNVLGSQIASRMIRSDKGSNKYTFDTSSLTPGIYLYSLKSGDRTISRRLIVSAH